MCIAYTRCLLSRTLSRLQIWLLASAFCFIVLGTLNDFELCRTKFHPATSTLFFPRHNNFCRHVLLFPARVFSKLCFKCFSMEFKGNTVELNESSESSCTEQQTVGEKKGDAIMWFITNKNATKKKRWVEKAIIRMCKLYSKKLCF